MEISHPGRTGVPGYFYGGPVQRGGQGLSLGRCGPYGSYAFGYLHTGKLPEHAAFILHNDVLPRYGEWGLEVKAVLTHNGKEYCGREHHPYDLYLELNDIKHRRTKVNSPRTNGFVELFNRPVLDEFFRPALRQTFYDSVEVLQKDLNEWLRHYTRSVPTRATATGRNGPSTRSPTSLKMSGRLLNYTRRLKNPL